MTKFQRARSAEQREIRRRAILDTTAAMLDEMPVSEISLNELSRRVGLAKSNVLRYFESREAILLELLDRATKRWVSEFSGLLAAEGGPNASARERGDRFAAVLARSLVRHPVLCDLFSAQAAVLEHNVSVEVVARHKRAMRANLVALAEPVRRHLPELGAHVPEVCFMAAMAIGAVWPHSRPSDSTLAAYRADPELAVMRVDFAGVLEEMVAALVAGVLARAAP
ncbi:TetR/AcrR family transcriptional regulator [Marinactinospora rubrisoli]|uniref:TetR family transcriptional regulator n=1 Tax=Marinactinospora rubrisoli TaxID=2715399 RepID=A0ABW2KFX7_9ACTN